MRVGGYAGQVWIGHDLLASVGAVECERDVGNDLADVIEPVGCPGENRMGTSVSGWQFCPGKKGGERAGRGWRGNGSWVTVVSDGNGLPLALELHSAAQRESSAAAALVAAVRVPQARGRPRQRPRRLVADKGFASAALRTALRRRGITPVIPFYPRGRKRTTGTGRPRPKQRHFPVNRLIYAQRWKIERTFAWMDNCRRLVVRYERSAHIYRAFCILAFVLFCLNRILK
jgi:transposase